MKEKIKSTTQRLKKMKKESTHIISFLPIIVVIIMMYLIYKARWRRGCFGKLPKKGDGE